MNFSRILDIAWKEILQLRRDRRMLPMVIISPVLQLIIYGYAISTTVTNIETAVYDADRTPASRQLIRTVGASRYFILSHFPSDLREVDRLLDRGSVMAAIVIPPKFGESLARETPVSLQVIVDGTDANTASTVLGYLQAIFRSYSQRIIIERMGRLPEAGVDARVRVWYNPTLESRNYMIPGIIAMVLLQITMNLTAIAIVKERERGTIEQLIVTPIRRHELIAGKVLPYAVIGYVDVFLVLLAGMLIFRVPVQGSIPLLLVLAGVFLLSTIGIGLFISAVSRNQQQSTMAISFVMLPSFLLSGFFYPIENMPAFIQPITYFIPLRYFLVIVRSIFLKGTGIALLWDQILPLTVLGLAIIIGSTLAFRKKLE